MPSLRKKVSTYFRQLSFHNSPRHKRNYIIENQIVANYLQGQISIVEGPSVIHGKTPEDLPNYQIGIYEKGYDSIVACLTGPGRGLTTVEMVEKCLSIHEDDNIDYIDTPAQSENLVSYEKSTTKLIDNTKMVIRVAGQEYFVQNESKKCQDTECKVSGTGKKIDDSVEKSVSQEQPTIRSISKSARDPKKLHQRGETVSKEWNRKTDMVFGISDSLYDMNMARKKKNGDPVADCFGVISRNDSMILAVADGVNWGEKACIAAKSAVHGCVHYLNKTIFNDTTLFGKQQQLQATATSQFTNTREVFVCLLRAFKCAHDLILENNGMHTTLTAVVVLPLENGEYVCCACNVGDTLAYVYSHLYGLRELTKGSHDINANRDLRDALGALGPVEGINPELGNLTLAITVLKKGDIVLVASDGLTDNFDPNVCKFTVSTRVDKSIVEQNSASRFPRSKTTLGKVVEKNEEGIPYVTPKQRYELQLLLMEDILKRSNEFNRMTSRKLCENLLNFSFGITATKRRSLEDMELYFDHQNGVSIELSSAEKRNRRKKRLEKVASLPGKLDHVTIVAGNVGNLPCG